MKMPTPTPSLDCQQNIPTNGPAATDIANALQKNNQLATVCATKFNRPGNSTRITFNHGYIDLTLERSSPDGLLDFCKAALNSIINICILGSNDYGGVFYQGGETYNISNSIYPKNPLIPNIDQGAPDATTTTQSTPGPTGFSIVTLSCNGCDNLFPGEIPSYVSILEVVPSTRNSCENSASNKRLYFGAAFPTNADTTSTKYNIEPSSLLTSGHDDFTIYYVYGDYDESKLCGLDHLNITFSKTDSGYGISYLTSHTFLLFSYHNICLQTGSTLIITREPAKINNQHLLHVIT